MPVMIPVDPVTMQALVLLLILAAAWLAGEIIDRIFRWFGR